MIVDDKWKFKVAPWLLAFSAIGFPRFYLHLSAFIRG